MLPHNRVKPRVLFRAQPVLRVILIVVEPDIEHYNVDLQTVLGVRHIVLVDPSVCFQPSRRVHRLSDEIQVDVPLSVFRFQPEIRVIRPIVMVVPNPDHLCSFLHQLIIYIFELRNTIEGKQC